MRLIRILTDSAIYWLCNTWSSAQVFTSFWDIAHQISDIWTLATQLQNCHPPSFKPKKIKTTRPKSLEWCASLIRSLYWLTRLIWIDLWVYWTDLVYLIGWIQYIHICRCIPNILYLMVTYFMRLHTQPSRRKHVNSTGPQFKFHSSEVTLDYDCICSFKWRELFLGHQVYGLLPCAGKPGKGLLLHPLCWFRLFFLPGCQRQETSSSCVDCRSQKEEVESLSSETECQKAPRISEKEIWDLRQGKLG